MLVSAASVCWPCGEFVDSVRRLLLPTLWERGGATAGARDSGGAERATAGSVSLNLAAYERLAQGMAAVGYQKQLALSPVISGCALDMAGSSIELTFNSSLLKGDTLVITPQGKLMDEMGRTTSIIKTDIAASNGVVHVIDRVLMPQ